MCAHGVTDSRLAERVELGPGRRRGLALRFRPRRVLERGLERQLEGRVVAVAVVLVADCATLDDLREAVTTLEETLLLARRVLGRTHPITGLIDKELRNARAALRAREAGKRVVFEYK